MARDYFDEFKSKFKKKKVVKKQQPSSVSVKKSIQQAQERGAKRTAETNVKSQQSYQNTRTSSVSGRSAASSRHVQDQRTPSQAYRDRVNQKSYGTTQPTRRASSPTSSNANRTRNTPATAAEMRRQQGQNQKSTAGISREQQEKTKQRFSTAKEMMAARAEEGRKQKMGENSVATKEQKETVERAIRNTPSLVKKAAIDAGEGHLKTIADFTEMSASSKKGVQAKAMKMGIQDDPRQMRWLEKERAETAKQAKAERERLQKKQDKRQAEWDKKTKGAKGLEKAYYGAVESGVGMATDMVIGLGTPGASLAAMGSRTYGSTRGQAQKEGATEKEDRLYSLLQAGKEVGTELMFPGAGLAKKAYGKAGIPLAERAANRLIKGLSGRAADVAHAGFRLAGGMAEENIEEIAGWGLDPLIKEFTYGKNVRKREAQEVMNRISEDMRSKIRDENDAASASAYLSSDTFLEDTKKDYMEEGLSEKEAEVVANKMRDFLTASLIGDTETMERLEDEISKDVAKAHNILEDYSGKELLETIASTSLLTGVTGLPGSVTSSMRGAALRDELGEKGIRALAKTAIDFEDETDSYKGQAARDRLDSGKELTSTQVYELAEATQKQIEKDSKRQEASVDNASKQIRSENLVSPYGVDARGEMVLDETTDKNYESSARSAESTIKNFVNNSEEKESLTDTEIRDGSRAIAGFKTGIFTLDDANELNYSNTAVREAFKEETGIDLNQYVVKDKNGKVDIPKTNAATKDALFAMASDNLVESAREATVNWMDNVKGEVVSQVTARMGAEGSLALQSALDDVDERNRSEYMMVANASDMLYQSALNLGTEWDNVKAEATKMFPNISEEKLQAMYKAGLDDRAKATYEYEGKKAKLGEAIASANALEDSDRANVTGKVFVDTETPLKGTIVRAFTEVATNLGVDIHLVDNLPTDSGQQANGMYDKGTIYINANSSFEQNMGYIFMHEVTHHLKEYAPEEYAALERLVREKWFEYDDAQMQSEIAKRIDLYSRATNGKQTLTEAEALEEIIADAAHEFLNDPNFANEVAEDNPSLAKAVLESIRNALRMLRRILSTGSIDDETHMNSLFSQLEIFDEAERLWLNAYRTAVANKAALAIDNWQDDVNAQSGSTERLSLSDSNLTVQGNTARWTDSRIDSLIRENGASDERYSKAWAAMMSPRDFLKLTIDDGTLEKWMQDENETMPLDEEKLRGEGQTPFLIIDDTETVDPATDFSHRVTGHEGRHRMIALMNAGVESVPVAIRGTEATKYKKTSIPELTLAAQDYFGEGGVNNEARVNALDLVPIKESNRDELIEKFGGDADVRFSISAQQDADYMKAVESGDMETAQRMVDEAAEKKGWRPAHRYHGSMNANFTQFNKRFAKVGGNSGAGFYFSTDEDDSVSHYEDVEGADNYFKWSKRAEEIWDAINEGTWEGEELDTYEEVEAYAKKELNSDPGTFDVYLAYDNPYIRDYKNSTNIYDKILDSFAESLIDESDYENEDDYYDAYYDAKYNHISEEIYGAVYNANSSLEDNYEVLYGPMISDIADMLTQHANEYESLTWTDIIDTLYELGETEVINDDWSESADATPEITRAIIEEFGFDAVEDKEVSSKFGQLSREMMTDTEHIIVFKPEQIKDSSPVTYDDDGNVIPLSERFNQENPDIRFSISAPVERVKDLVAVHNVKETDLPGMLELGGMPVPSIAVIKASMGHDKYGDISFLFHSDTIDPQKSRYNKVYGGDAYTPTFPSVSKKISYDKAEEIRSKLKDILNIENEYQDVPSGLQFPSLDTDNLTNYLDYREPHEAFSNGRGSELFKLAYLKDAKGMDVEVPMKTDNIKGENADFWDKLDKILPELTRGDAYNMSYEDAKQYEPAIRELLNKQFAEKFPDSKIVLHSEELPYGDLTGPRSYIAGMVNYRENGLPQVVDTVALDKTLKESVDEEGYNKWIDDLFDGIIEKKGLRNNKDLFTPSGNRRSWEALHDPVTIEAVVNIMRNELDQGGESLFGANPKGAAQKSYKTLDEIIADEDRLQILDEEEYSALTDEGLSKMAEVAQSIVDSNTPGRFGKEQFGAALDVGGFIAEVLNETRNKDSMKRLFDRDYGMKVSDEQIDEILAATEILAEAPTGYFEAKPKRAVGFNEVKAAIVPEDTSEDILNELELMEIPVTKYNKEVEGDRAAKLNEVADAEQLKFSISEDIMNTLEDNFNEYKEDKANLRIATEAIADLRGVSVTGENLSGQRWSLDETASQGGVDNRADSGISSARTIAKGITSSLVNEGYIDFIGQKVESPEDLAKLGQVLRDPRFETFRLVLTKGNKIVSFQSCSARMPGLSPVHNEENDGIFYDKIKEQMKKLGADGYYLMHNHPSGDVTASEDDRRVTANSIFKLGGEAFKGHVILDHDKFGLISNVDVLSEPGKVSLTDREVPIYGQQTIDLIHEPEVDHPLLGEKANNGEIVASIGEQVNTSNDYSVIIYVSSKLNVRGIQEVSNKEIEKDLGKFKTFIRDQGVEFGSISAFLYSPSGSDVSYNTIENLFEEGVILDAVYGDTHFFDLGIDRYGDPSTMGRSKGEINSRITVYESFAGVQDYNSVRYSITPKMDADYMAAVENYQKLYDADDIGWIKAENEIAKMVDQAAVNAGYATKAYHGTPSEPFNVFNRDYVEHGRLHGDGFYFSPYEDIANQYGETRAYYLKTGLLNEEDLLSDKWLGAQDYKDFTSIDEALAFYEEKQEEYEKYGQGMARFRPDVAMANGRYRVLYTTVGVFDQGLILVAMEPEYAKFAEPITYAEDGSVIPLSQRFNSDNQDMRYSLPTSDAEGTALSNGQIEFFEQSKVRNGAGQLKVMLHGTDADFTEFDPSKARPGTLGRAFYFSDSDAHAGQYGNVGKYYLNLEHPLMGETHDITKDQLRKFVAYLADNEDYGIENYGADATVDSVTDSVWGGTDFTMLRDLNLSAVGDFAEAVKVFNRVNGTDYDGIITDVETAAFYPEQIKRTDNLNPTLSKDTRYSITDSENRELSDGQVKYFRNSQARDEQGRLVPVFHTTNKGGFTVFDPSRSDDRRSLFFASNFYVSQTYGRGAHKPIDLSQSDFEEFVGWDDFSKRIENYVAKFYWKGSASLSDNLNAEVYNKETGEQVMEPGAFEKWGKAIAEGKDGSKYRVEIYLPIEDTLSGHYYEHIIADSWEELLSQVNSFIGKELSAQSGYYKTYLNLENPLIIDANGANWNSIPYGNYNENAVLAIKNITVQDIRGQIYVNVAGDRKVDNEWQEFRESKTIDYELDHDEIPNAVWNQVYDFFIEQGLADRVADDYADGTFFDYNGLDTYDENGNKIESEARRYRTRQLAEIAQKEGYDGVIIRNCYDIGGVSPLRGDALSDIYIAFSSNQVKDVNNLNPTENPDIRFSIPPEEETVSRMAYEAAEDDSIEILEYYEQRLANLTDEEAENIAIRDYDEDDAALFYSALRSEEPVPYEDYVLEEDRIRMAKSKNDFFSNVNAKWNDRWTTEPGGVLDVKSVKNDVRNLIMGVMQNSDTDSKYKRTLVNKTLMDVRYAYEFFKKDRPELASALLYHSAQRMIDNVQFYVDGTFDQYKELKHYLRNTKISIGEEYWADVEYDSFRKRNYNRINLVKGKTNVDQVYQELEELFPEFFDSEETMDVPSQLLQMEYVLDSVQPYKEAYSSEAAAELAFDIADDLYEIMVNGDEVRSLADTYKARYDAKTKAMKQRHAEAMLTYRKLRDAEIAELGSYYQQELEKQKDVSAEEIRQLREDYEQKLRTEGRKADFEIALLKENRAFVIGKLRAEKWNAVRRERERIRRRQTESKERQQEAKLHTKHFDRISENYKWLKERLLTNTKDKHIPEQYKKELAGLLAAFDLQTVGSKKLEAKRGYQSQKTIQMSALRTGFEAMHEAYPTFFIHDAIMDKMKELAKKVDGKTIDALDVDQLAEIDDILKGIKSDFINYDKIFVRGKQMAAADPGKAQAKIALEHAEKFGPGTDYQNAPGLIDKIINLEEMTAPYLFRRIDPNKEGLGMMYGEIRRAFDKYVRNQNELNGWMKDIVGKYHQKGILWNKYGSGELANWRSENYAVTFNFEGGSATLTPAQMMSIYCLAKRPQAQKHMYSDVGGIVVAPVSFNAKILSDVKKKANKALPVRLTESDVQQIVAKLTPEQIQVAEQLQELMSTKMAEWGNEASMDVMGIELFKEENYFPIKSDKASLTQELNDDQFVQAIRNFGFAKALMPEANNPIMVEDIFDVVTEHCNNMNLYNAYSKAFDDFMKVYNYKDYGDGGSNYTVQQAVAHAYSHKATTFIMTFLRDLNGNVSGRASGIEDTYNSLLGNAKKAAVFANLRVAAQQPTAITRALYVIDLKYASGIKIEKGAMQEMFEHCPIALWKSWGYYDINMGKSIEDIMMNNGKWLEDKATDLYGALDNVTWTAIWQMVKAEIKDKHPNVEIGSDEYWELCNERMSEVVDLTQVVDSPLHRSHAMRSKNFLVKTATAFMAEPTLTFNMLRDGWVRAREAKKLGNHAEASKIIGRTIAVALLQAVTVAGAAGLIDALRKKHPDKDDEDERILHLWLVNFVENLKDELKLWNKVYVLKDIASIAEGWDNANLALQGFQKASLGWRQLKGDPYARSSATWYENLGDGLGYMFGVPVKTMRTGIRNAMDMFGVTSPIIDATKERLDSIADNMKDRDTKSTIVGMLASDDIKIEGNGVFGKLLAKADESDKKSSKKSKGKGKSKTNTKMTHDEERDKLRDLEAKARENAEGLSGSELDDALWDTLSEGYTKQLDAGNLDYIEHLALIYRNCGGDENIFREKIKAKIGSAYKKTFKDNPTDEDLYAQDRMRHFMEERLGMTEEEVSAIVYKTDAARDLKVAFKINNEEYINNELTLLARAGITYEDVEKLYKNRNRMKLETYNGKYKDMLKSTGKYLFPADGIITSDFGNRNSPGGIGSTNHQGLDIAGPKGTPIQAADGGTVIMAGWYGGYGKTVQIQHDDGTVTQYSHLDWWDVNEGDTVAQGQEVGLMGNTGNSTGPHLHFGVMKNGEYVDPKDYINTLDKEWNLNA